MTAASDARSNKRTLDEPETTHGPALSYIFRDFDLKLSRDHFQLPWVEAIGPPGRRSNPINLELPDGVEFLDALQRFRAGRLKDDDWQLLGRPLFRALFPPQIAQIWDKEQSTTQSGTILRLRLDARDPELAAMPWELALDGDYPLALSSRRPITRCRYDANAPVPSLSVVPERVLVVAPAAAGLSQLRAREEISAIRDRFAAAGHPVDLHELRPATSTNLQAMLQGRFDLLHYIGHGAFTDGVGYLRLEDGDVHGPDFASLLQRSSVRIVVLNSCEGGVSSPTGALLGVAQAALAAGVPAVVAMQGVVTDVAAVEFADAFYEKLAAHEPLEVCVTEARRALFQLGGEQSGDWALPVLFSAFTASGLVEAGARLRLKRRTHHPGKDRFGRPPASKVMAYLPERTSTQLIGRDSEIVAIRKALAPDGDDSAALVVGAPGIGCTALAREVAEQLLNLSRNDPDNPESYEAIVWATGSHLRMNLFEATEPEEVVPLGLGELCHRLALVTRNPSLAQASPEERSSILYEVLAQGRYLLVLNNIDEMRARDRLHVVQIPERSRLLATANAPLDVGTEMILHGLDADSASILLRQHVNRNASTKAMRALVDACQGNPLTLRWAGGQLTMGDLIVDEITGVLSSAQPHTVADTCLNYSITRLSADVRSVMWALALFPQPPNVQDISGAVGLDMRRVRRCLLELSRHALIGRPPDGKTPSPRVSGRARYHALASLRRQPEVARDLTARAVRQFAARLTATPEGRLAQYGEVANAIWAIRQAFELEDWQTVLALKDATHDDLFDNGYTAETLVVGELAWDAGDRLGDRRRRARSALYPMARINLRQGNNDEAEVWSERARALFLQERDSREVARAERYLGRALQAKGQLDRARRVFTTGLRRAQQFHSADDAHLHGDMLASVAGLEERFAYELQIGGDERAARQAFRRAIRRYQEALERYLQTDNEDAVITTFISLGRTSLGIGETEQARNYLESSFASLRGKRSPKRLGDVLLMQARLAEIDGDQLQAARLLRDAWEQYAEVAAFAELARVDAAIARVSATLARSTRRSVDVHERAGTLPPASRPGARVTESRYLHVRARDSVRVGETLSVLVRVGRVAGDPHSAALRPFAIPPEGATLTLVVSAPEFRVRGPDRALLTVRPKRDSEWVQFELKALAPGVGQVAIEAWWAGSPLGELRFRVDVTRERANAPEIDRIRAISDERDSSEVSLTVRSEGDGDGRYRFEFRDEDYPVGVVAEAFLIPPSQQIAALVHRLDGLTSGGSSSSRSVRQELVSLGQNLWRTVVPNTIQQQFWERIHRIKQLTIVTDDRNPFPWELLHPSGKHKPGDFLVRQIPVVRANFNRDRTRTLHRRPAKYVSPPGSPAHTQQELEDVSRLLDASSPVVLGTRTELWDSLAQGDVGVFHFACHNRFPGRDSDIDGPSIHFGANEQFSLLDMEMVRSLRSLERSAPLVFLNACRSAGQVVAYTKLDSWVEAFLDAGAGAFIGSSWNVRDTSARRFAETFYRAMSVERLSFASAVFEARLASEAEIGDPTWLAYTAYGHPSAKFVDDDDRL